MKRYQIAFGLLILTQAAHSIEEYFGRLWELFLPASFVTGLVSEDREFGFLALNVALVTFGVWCYLFPVLRRWRSARGIALGWAVVELINGIGHPLWSLRQGGYTPGLVTAPILLVLSLMLFSQQRASRNDESAPVG
ncbi:MAG TPA: HXXEE domain-containing protein [Dehalococcoidia bacterium]